MTGTAEASATSDNGPTPSLRWRLVALVVLAVVLVAIAVTASTRSKAVTPEQFVAFSERLGTVPAPAGSFTPYDPTLSSYLGSEPQGTWSLIATDTWSNTEDASWWTAVRGWETTVTVGQERIACGDALAWLASTGKALGLTTPGQNEDLAVCLSVLDTVRSEPGNANDAWGGRGMQSADGQLRYRTGVETFTGTRHGDAVIRVTADASVANR